MKQSKDLFKRRFVFMLLGVVSIAMCVGSFRLSNFGVDPYSCMNLGISAFLGMQFGTWQLIMNALVLILQFFLGRKWIGAGTLFNMVCVGYGADLICYVARDVLDVNMTLPLRILALVVGMVLAGIGVAFFMTADLGLAPYDSVGMIIEKQTKGKIAYQYARIMSDVLVVLVGVSFCLAAKAELKEIAGIATVINACLLGPVIAFFKRKVTGPLFDRGNKA